MTANNPGQYPALAQVRQLVLATDLEARCWRALRQPAAGYGTCSAASGMAVYKTLPSEVDRIVGRTNGHFSTFEWTPVRHFYRSLAFKDVVAHYAAAAVAWITPLRDGLSLVATHGRFKPWRRPNCAT